MLEWGSNDMSNRYERDISKRWFSEGMRVEWGAKIGDYLADQVYEHTGTVIAVVPIGGNDKEIFDELMKQTDSKSLALNNVVWASASGSVPTVLPEISYLVCQDEKDGARNVFWFKGSDIMPAKVSL